MGDVISINNDKELLAEIINFRPFIEPVDFQINNEYLEKFLKIRKRIIGEMVYERLMMILTVYITNSSPLIPIKSSPPIPIKNSPPIPD